MKTLKVFLRKLVDNKNFAENLKNILAISGVLLGIVFSFYSHFFKNEKKAIEDFIELGKMKVEVAYMNSEIKGLKTIAERQDSDIKKLKELSLENIKQKKV